MIIANPIYDTVFKFLMESKEVAKDILSEIIKEEILELHFSNREMIRKKDGEDNFVLSVFHLDFVAKIKTKENSHKNVIIELQKSNFDSDIMRFRNYLGKQYQIEEEITDEFGNKTVEALPIISVYILGFKLSETLPAVIKVNRNYIDVISGKELTERHFFIEKLTHDSYVIQIPHLKTETQNDLEMILSIFEQKDFIEDTKNRLKNYKHDIENAKLKRILKRLELAASDPKLAHEIELEEIANREYAITLGKKDKIIIEKDKIIIEKDKIIVEKDKALSEKDKIIEELRMKLGK
jgi:hypothetical protein